MMSSIQLQSYNLAEPAKRSKHSKPEQRACPCIGGCFNHKSAGAHSSALCKDVCLTGCTRGLMAAPEVGLCEGDGEERAIGLQHPARPSAQRAR